MIIPLLLSGCQCVFGGEWRGYKLVYNSCSGGLLPPMLSVRHTTERRLSVLLHFCSRLVLHVTPREAHVGEWWEVLGYLSTTVVLSGSRETGAQVWGYLSVPVSLPTLAAKLVSADCLGWQKISCPLLSTSRHPLNMSARSHAQLGVLSLP